MQSHLEDLKRQGPPLYFVVWMSNCIGHCSCVLLTNLVLLTSSCKIFHRFRLVVKIWLLELISLKSYTLNAFASCLLWPNDKHRLTRRTVSKSAFFTSFEARSSSLQISSRLMLSFLSPLYQEVLNLLLTGLCGATSGPPSAKSRGCIGESPPCRTMRVRHASLLLSRKRLGCGNHDGAWICRYSCRGKSLAFDGINIQERHRYM